MEGGSSACAHKKWIPNTFLYELLAETLPRCFQRECSPYPPFASEFINFSRSYGIFPHFAETSDRSNCLFFLFLFSAKVAGLLEFINKISPQNFSI